MSFRVVTYNIHRGKGMDWRVRPDRIAGILREIDADIVAIQEVVSSRGVDREADQIRYLADSLGLNSLFGYNQDFRGAAYGNLLLTRFRIEYSRKYDISFRNRTRRGVMRVDLRLPGAGLVHVFNVHLGTAFFERRYQARKLMSEDILRSPDLTGPRLMLGDFNEWTRGLVTRSLNQEMESADLHHYLHRRRTYPGFIPLMHLDHIYHDPELRIESLRLHRSTTALVASDHLPLVAEIAMNGHKPGSSRARRGSGEASMFAGLEQRFRLRNSRGNRHVSE
jgi:endonuclease/exonuclease/phosphatase family metal-dependent hydrolase